MGTRKADKAGSWYAGTATGMKAEVAECLEEAERQFGRATCEPGTAPTAAVVPHAGLAFSGAVAAVAYRLIRDALKQVDCFVVFGACHRARIARPGIWARGAWQTPAGDIPIDAELAMALVADGLGEENEAAHAGDNAVELQTPFIRCMFPEAKMVPVAMSFFPNSWRLGELAAQTAARSGKVVVALASTDLTHYGAAFGLMPAGTGDKALAWIRDNDARFLSALAELRLDDIVPTAAKDSSACGAGAAAAAAGWAQSRGCRRGALLAQTNSHAIMPRGEAEHVVGYASLAYAAPRAN